jgi:hypothetical protein
MFDMEKAKGKEIGFKFRLTSTRSTVNATHVEHGESLDQRNRLQIQAYLNTNSSKCDEYWTCRRLRPTKSASNSDLPQQDQETTFRHAGSWGSKD